MKLSLLLLMVVASCTPVWAETNSTHSTASTILFKTDFESVPVDSVPDDFLVLNGTFAVKEEGGRKFLELPATPLETFGVLFGPTETDSVSVSARIFGTAKGRLFPSFAVGLNGVTGFRLQVSPAKRAMELYVGDELKTQMPFMWKSETWTLFHLQVQKSKPSGWKVQGKVWAQTDTQPKDWTIVLDWKEEPPSGRASIWGSPYSAHPIRFDDLAVTRLPSAP